MSFKSETFGEDNHESFTTEENIEIGEKKLEEYVGMIMKEDGLDDVEKMGLASQLMQTFNQEDGQKLLDRVDEEIKKSKMTHRKDTMGEV